jgi:hypothetical protein
MINYQEKKGRFASQFQMPGQGMKRTFLMALV